ncbi:MAG: hypothetical protein Q8P89_03140 [bacterium]|nr:hypothetical protein [bacterium]
MNQEIRPGLTNIGQSLHNCSQLYKPKAKYNGERTIFMADDQGQEELPKPAIAPSAEKISSAGISPEGQKGNEASPALSATSTDYLRQEYRKLMQAIGAEGDRGLSEELARELQPRLRELSEKLGEMGVDMTELSTEVRKGLPEELRRRGPGSPAADRIILDETSPEELKIWARHQNSLSDGEFYNMRRLRDERERLVEFMFRAQNPLPEEEVNKALEVLRDPEITREAERRYHEELSKERGHYGQHNLTDPEKDCIKGNTSEDEHEREKIFNRMFIRVDVKPRTDFRDAFGMAGEIEYNDFITTLIDSWEKTGDLGEKERLDKLITKYSQEKDLRETLHNANYSLAANVSTEKFTGFLQTFTSDMADAAYRLKGVTLAAHMYEQALKQVIDENGGYLPAVEVAIEPTAPRVTGREGRVESLAMQYLNEAIDAKLLKVRNEAGEIETIPRLEEWEKRRAISLARGMGIATLRTVEILGSVKLPDPERTSGMPSLYGQDIVRDLVPFRHLIGKFGLGKERLAVLAFAINRGNKPWTQQELIKFLKSDKGAQRIANGEALGELGEIYLNRIIPFEFGSGWSHSDWRPKAATDYLDARRQAWIGTGVRLERLRGELKGAIKKDDKAQKDRVTNEARTVLTQIARIQPLKLLNQMPELDLQGARDRFIQVIFGFSPAELRELNQLRWKIKDKDLKPKEREDLEIRLQVLQAKEQELSAGSERLSQAQRDLALAQERTLQEGVYGDLEFEDAKLNFDGITEADGRRANAEALATAIQNTFLENNGRNLKILQEKISRDDWGFIIGTDDVPYDLYQFVETGPTGLVARTMRDFASESKAVMALINVVNKMHSYHKQEDIIKDLEEIYAGIKGYDEDKARRAILKIAEGICKFYAKDWQARLPLGIGSLVGFLGDRGLLPNHRKASFAKTAFGKEAPAWDEEDKRKFTRALHAAGMLDYKQLAELEKRVGATIWYDAWAKTRTFGPLGLLMLLMEMGRVFTKDMTK